MDEEYIKAKRLLWDKIGNGKDMVLSTASNNSVTSRTISAALCDEKIYVMTYQYMNKCSQIMENKNVALCLGLIQMTAIADIIGSPLNIKNTVFANAHREAFPKFFDLYVNSPDSVLIEITPTTALFYTDNGYNGYFIDFSNKNAKRLIEEY